MEIIKEFFVKNLDGVYVIYGFAFILMGIVIFIKNKKDSKFEISKILNLLAVFGVIHGIHEWLVAYSLTRETKELFDIIRNNLLIISYLFLFEFGRRLAALTKKDFSNIIAGISFIGFILSGIFITNSFSVSSRYFLAFPGAILSVIGLKLYFYSKQKELKVLLRLKGYLIAIGWAFIIFGILGGLLVSKQSFYPANIFNSETFFDLVGIPVQIFRTVCAVVVTISIIKILTIFDWESEQEIKQALLKTAECKKYSESIIKNLSDTLIVLTEDGKVDSVNNSGLLLLGYKEEDLIGHEIKDIFGDKAAFKNNLDKIISQGDLKNYETVIISSANQKISVLFSGNIFTSEKDKTKKIVCLFKDITDFKKILNDLEEAEVKYYTFLEASNDLIWQMDLEGNIVYCNSKTEEATGYSFKDWVSKNFGEVVLEEELPYIISTFDKVLEGNISNFEGNILKADGQKLKLFVNMVPFYKNFKIVGVICFGVETKSRKA